MKLVVLLLALLATFSLVSARGLVRLGRICDRDSEIFKERHRNQVDSEQAVEGQLWRQAVAVIAQVPVTPDTLQWAQVASFDFWQDNVWSPRDCAWNATQAWPRVDPVTGEFYLAMQRIQAAATRPFTRFINEDGEFEYQEAESQYDTSWVKGAYLEESAIVINSEVLEYAMGDQLVVGGWYDKTTGRLGFVNTFFTYVPGHYRSYSYSTILENVPGDPTTSFKVMTDITSTTEVPPTLIAAAFDWFNAAIEDDSTQLEINPNTGLGEYVFRPSQHLQGAAAKHVSELRNTEPSMNMHNAELMKAVIDEHRQE